SYAEVAYRDVYPGVNVVYYGNQQRLEYDFEVAAGADYRQIEIAFDRTARPYIDASGSLLVGIDGGHLVQRAPEIYQETDHGRQAIAGGYERRDGDRIGFWIGPHDSDLPLVIDPILTYSSYLGGGNEERAAGVAVDSQGNIYVAGLTGAADFPATGTPA